MKTYLGIEVGGTKLQLVTGVGKTIIGRQSFAVAHGQSQAIRKQIEAAVASLRLRFSWDAVGVGFGGPVDRRTGKICCSHQVGGWEDFPIQEWLHQLTGAPVVLENDTNAATLAEAMYGAGVGFNPVFYTNSGSGVGGGLVVEGRIYHGATPGEAELAHIRLDRSGTTVEQVCSGWAVDKKVKEVAAHHPESILGHLAGCHKEHQACALSQALMEGCPFAQCIVNETATDLAFGLSHVVHLFHPEVIVLGGGLALIGEPWRAAIATALPKFIMQAFQPGPAVRLASLGQDTVPVGALILAEQAANS